MSKRVLLICYYFPPLGGAGVSRPLAIFKHLSQFGFEVDVLTVKNIAYRTYEPELLNDINTKQIYRARSFDPQRMLYLLGMRKLKEKTISKGKPVSDKFFPDSKIGWVKSAVKFGRTLIENKKYDLIISSSPPISSHLVAKKLSKEYKLPWLADFRDYWTSYKPEDWFENQSTITRAKKLLLEIKEKASALTTVSEPIADYLGGGHIIYNSYSDDSAKLWDIPSKQGTFNIGILGTIDKLCPVKPLFELLSCIKNKNYDLFEKIKLIQVGNINDSEFQQQLLSYDLTGKIDISNHLPRNKSVELLNKTHMMYLGLNQKYEQGIVTSRIFDLIVSGRPLLCSVSQESVISSLIKPIENAISFQQSELENAYTFIEKNVEQWQTGSLHINPRSEYAQEFSSIKMVEKFYELIVKMNI